MDNDSRSGLLNDVEQFCQAIRPEEELAYLEHRFNDKAIELAREYDLLGMAVPTELGGRGADCETYARAIARIGREGSGLRTLFSAHSSIGQYPIQRFGTNSQKETYLRPSATGDKLLAFGLTEPAAGSNPRELQSTYRKEPHGYVLNGMKYLISNGGIADAIVAFAYPEDSHDRMSAFIVDTTGSSFQSEDLTAKVGLPTSNTAMFELSEHAVPTENMLGEEGDGLRIAMSTLVRGRLSVAAGCLGVIEDCLDEAVHYSRDRTQHGKPIAQHQLVQDHIAQIELQRVVTESVLATAIAAVEGSEADMENLEKDALADHLVAAAKYIASHAACDAADRAVQVFGGRGYSLLFRPARHWSDVRVCRIYEGTDEIIKLKLASALLGKEHAAFR